MKRQVDIDDLGVMLSGFQRYSMGRKSYVVSECCDTIVKYFDELTPRWKSIIYRDLREKLLSVPRELGMKIDEQCWEDLHVTLAAKIKRSEDLLLPSGRVAYPKRKS